MENMTEHQTLEHGDFFLTKMFGLMWVAYTGNIDLKMNSSCKFLYRTHTTCSCGNWW